MIEVDDEWKADETTNLILTKRSANVNMDLSATWDETRSQCNIIDIPVQTHGSGRRLDDIDQQRSSSSS